MKIGTRSLLFGAHQIIIHAIFVGIAWWKLFGFPFDPRLWLAFLVHDIGYIGKGDMDGIEGEKHVELGARIMSLFGDEWSDLCLCHSRFYAKKTGRGVSRLCIADKLAIALTPAWIYLPLAKSTGEIREYMALARARRAAGEPRYASMKATAATEARWYADMQEYMRRWVEKHKDGGPDTWTPAAKEASGHTGVWK